MSEDEIKSAIKGLKEFYVAYMDNRDNRIHRLMRNNDLAFENGTVSGRDTTGWTVSFPMSKAIYIADKAPEWLEAGTAVGSDPEMFFVKDGKVVPSFAVIEQETDDVTRDGFQLELHPQPSTCRESAGTYIGYALRHALDMAKKAGATLSFDVGHTIHDEVWKRTPVDVKRFGCNPTLNAQEKEPKRVTGLRERFRAGAGHIHLGFNYPKLDRPKLVKVLDIVAGNTLVIIDRDPANIQRRKNYGRAGEYREKPYGIEYRVPSNFWLRHYVLWSLASGLCRNALALCVKGHTDDLLSRFDMKKVRDAINNNDRELAIENLAILVEFFKEKKLYTTTVFDFLTADKFFSWITSEEPLAKLACHTPEDSLNSWESKTQVRVDGFERFLISQK